MTDLTREGEQLVSAYIRAEENLRQARSRVNGAECDMQNAETALAKWLMPTDMKPGEKIAVWRGDSLFQVELAPMEAYSTSGDTVTVSQEPKVTVRTRGRKFSELRLGG